MNKIVQDTVLDWYKKNKRDLPWRKTSDPYHIVVSEMMLQQTPVDRVVPKYFEFLLKFPTIEKLAAVSPADVIDAWAGLGYNRRALYLHRFAREVMEKFGGKIPQRVEDLMGLSGIGPYTSRAILCFGFGKDAPVVDINIKRIYSRLFFRGKGTENELLNVAREMVPSGSGVDWSNALMDFGSLVCMDKPLCPVCPLVSCCTAYLAGVPEKYVKPKTQSAFIGSDRYYRSLIVKELRKSSNFSLSLEQIKKIKPAEKSEEWFEGIIDGLMRDGLIVRLDGYLSLPR